MPPSSRLMRFLAVEGVTGHEAAIGRTVSAELQAIGVPADAIRHDNANTRIPLPTETGNLIVTLPGTRPGPRLLFMTHLDTVPLCAGIGHSATAARLWRRGRQRLAAITAQAAQFWLPWPRRFSARKCRIRHSPCCSRSGRKAGFSRNVDAGELGNPAMGFNFDGRSASDVIIGAVGAERWEVEIHGKASHAGVYPEKGISATAVASLAIADIVNNGWFGKIVKSGPKRVILSRNPVVRPTKGEYCQQYRRRD